jgi:hypothetical protein
MGVGMATEKSKYSTLRFGWTGKKRYLSEFGRKCEKSFYTISEYLGVAILTVVMTQIRWVYKDNIFIDFTLADIIHYGLVIFSLMLIAYGRTHKGKDFNNLLLEKEQYSNDLLLEKEKFKDSDKMVRTLSEENVKAKQEYSDLHSRFLKNWLKASLYALKIDTPSHRVTIYAYTNENNFLYLSRYSQNTSYSELHSISFPINQGVISEAWKVGKHIDIENCPTFKSSPEEYIAYIQKNYNYSPEKINSLTMKSCQYVATTVNDEQGPIAVIVFENDGQTDPRISSQKVTQIMSYCETHNPQLVSYIREGIRCNTLGLKKSETNRTQISKLEMEMLNLNRYQENEGGKK